MSAAEWVMNAIDFTGLDLPKPMIARLVREYKANSRESGVLFSRRLLSSALAQLEYRAVAKLALARKL